MALPSKTELLILALKTRGYSEVTRDIGSAYRVFSISKDHLRRIDKAGSRIWLLNHHPRFGTSWTLGKPIPRATIQTLHSEGARVFAKAQAEAKLRPITLSDLNLEL